METIVLGGYTKRLNKGISTVQLDKESKTLSHVKQVVDIESPTYVEAIGDFIFTVMKDGNWGGVGLLEKQDDGQYQVISSLLTEDVNPPCYVSFDRKHQFIYSAYYHQGFFQVVAITDEGLELIDQIDHEGSSIHENQTSSHIHYVQIDKKNAYLLVCDLGTDEVYTYKVSADKVCLHDIYKTKAGFGPRHLVEHPTLPIVYVIGELSNEIDICRYEEGKLTSIAMVSLLPKDYTDWSSAAAIRISSDGHYLYASNRGHNSIVVYKVAEDGLLEPIQWVDTMGKTPRDFNFNKTEDYIIVGHQDDDKLVLFERNSDTGLLKYVHEAVAPECVCVSIVK